MIKTITLVLIVCALAQFSLASPDLLRLAEQGFKHGELREVLKQLETDVNDVRDDEKRTALHWSGLRSQFEDVLLLLQAGADANVTDAAGRTPLFHAVARKGGHAFLVVELLTLAGADANRIAADGSTPLSEAVKAGNHEAVEFLIRRGATLEVSGSATAQQPLAIAQEKGDTELVAMLNAVRQADVEAAATPKRSESVSRRFLAAARAADLNDVAGLLVDGVDINQRDANGATALLRAVSDRRPDLVTLLLFEGADPKIADAKGKTPLMAATSSVDHGGTRMLLLLLLAEADVNARDKDGHTALSEAVVRCNDFAAKWMIWQGANLNVKTPEGSLMQLAKARPHWPSMARLLKEHGVADDTLREPRREQALFEAVRAGDLAAVERELNRGIGVSEVDEEGCSALAWAAHFGHFEIIDLLLRRGADINQRNAKSSKTVLHELARWGEETAMPRWQRATSSNWSGAVRIPICLRPTDRLRS
jgi:ankyrin repeat protein